MFYPHAGDVALALGADASSKLLKASQRVLHRQASFYHASISLGGPLWCEASPIGGVHISTTSEAFLNHPPEKISLYRPLSIIQPTLDVNSIKRTFGIEASTIGAMTKIEI